MRRWITLSVVLAVSSTPLSSSSGQAQAPLPLRVRGVLDSRGETSCSQSFASDHHHADLTLVVTRSGRATLTSDSHTRSRSGPSFGRYRMGERDFTVVQSHEHAELTGRARRDGEWLVISFERMTQAQATWSGEGELPLPAATSAPFVSTLRCATRSTEVFPARVAEHERPETLDVLSCTMESRPHGLEAFGEVWYFAPGPGLITPWDTSGLVSEQSVRVRRAG